jgi:RNA polymerase sigma-70 factor, ECF subfamily
MSDENGNLRQTTEQLDEFRSYLTMLARAQFDGRLHGKLDPSDIVQQTMTEAYEHCGQFRGQSQAELAGWLRQVLVRNLVDAQRRFGAAKRDVARERSLDAAVNQSSIRLGTLLSAGQSSPSQKAMQHEQAVELARALEQLPDAQKEAVVLRHWHGRSLLNIAEVLDRTPAAVAGLLKRGLRQLREILDGGDSTS